MENDFESNWFSRSRFFKDIFFRKSIYLALFLIALSYVAYLYHIFLCFVFLLYPLFYVYIAEKNSKNTICILSALIWFSFNTLLLLYDFVDILDSSFSPIIPFINVLIVSWMNFFLCFVFFANLENNNNVFHTDKQIFITLVTVLITIINVVCMWETYFENYLEKLLIIGAIFSPIYSLIMYKAFTHETIIKINMILSLFPLITLISAFISIFFILNTTTIAHNYAIYLYPFYFTSFFQFTSISSICTIFIRRRTINKHTSLYKLLLAIMMSIGVLLQYSYSNFFEF